MGAGRYFAILTIMLVNFLALLNLIFRISVVKYELALTFIFMFFAFIIIIGFYYNSSWSYWLGAIFFAFNLLNMIYLYYQIISYSLILYAVAGALGFIVSVSSIRTEEDDFEGAGEKRYEVEKQLGDTRKETPKVEIIMDEKPAKKRPKQKTKKKGKKK